MKVFHTATYTVTGVCDESKSFASMVEEALTEAMQDRIDDTGEPYHASNGLVITLQHVSEGDFVPGTRQ